MVVIVDFIHIDIESDFAIQVTQRFGAFALYLFRFEIIGVLLAVDIFLVREVEFLEVPFVQRGPVLLVLDFNRFDFLIELALIYFLLWFESLLDFALLGSSLSLHLEGLLQHGGMEFDLVVGLEVGRVDLHAQLLLVLLDLGLFLLFVVNHFLLVLLLGFSKVEEVFTVVFLGNRLIDLVRFDRTLVDQ